MATPPSDQVHAKATKALAATEDLITEIAKHSPDPKQAEQLTAPLKQCSKIFKQVVEVSGKTQEPEPERPTIASATDEMMDSKSEPAGPPAGPVQEA